MLETTFVIQYTHFVSNKDTFLLAELSNLFINLIKQREFLLWIFPRLNDWAALVFLQFFKTFYFAVICSAIFRFNVLLILVILIIIFLF